MRTLLAWAVSASLVAILPPQAAAQTARFALVAGNDRGADRHRTLRYAERDARRFAELLIDLGGFAPENVVVLGGETAESFGAALAEIDRRIRQVVPERFPRAMLVVYFSGHADGLHLEFGDEKLPYERFRELVTNAAAQVKIAFVDSCQSGALIAPKGGRPGPAFDLVLHDAADAAGTVVVTSSAAGENSQESAEIQGSFFSHYLLSGLRGAADQDQNDRVTLAEVYAYTYDKTVVETSRTLGGTQHPAYQYDLHGRGELVLTDLARGQARLAFGPALAGEFLVLRDGNGEVLAELSKPYGTRRCLSLAAGSYRVALRRGERLFAGKVDLARGEEVRLRAGQLREEGSLLAAVRKGGVGRSGVSLFVQYGLLSGALDNFAAVHQALVGARIDLGPVSFFPRFGYGEASIDDDRLDYHIRLYSLDAIVAWRFAYSVLDLFAGLKAGVGYGTQRLTDERADGATHRGAMFSYAAVGGLDVPLVAGLALQVFWEAGAEAFKLDGSITQHLSLRGVVGLGYEF